MSEENKNFEEAGVPQEPESLETQELIESSIIAKDTQDGKKTHRISLKTFILSTAALVLAAVMLTYSVSSALFQKKYSDVIITETDRSEVSEKDYIDLLLGSYFYGEIDKEKMTAESLRSYLASTGDIYAAYYTQEELIAMTDEGAGRMYGVGVNVINSTVKISGREVAVLKIINVMKNSPAEENKLRAGDLIAYVGVGNDRQSVDALGYDEALNLLKGEEGTYAKFTVLRKNGDKYDEKEFTVPRREVVTESVYSSVHTEDAKIGIIKITGFEYKTPVQFEDAVEELREKGCDKFVIDLRFNPGGYLDSICAVLSYFLDEGDVYIRTEDKNKNVISKKIGVVSGYTGDRATCNVSKEDIGKYKDLNMVVLCNEYTASAAELFTATFKDYGLATVVGTNTFGKGKMQTTYSLAAFGLEGAVKFTTHMYYSAKSEGYDGIGIKPDVEIALSQEAAEYNIYDLPHNKDNQLLEAIKHFK